MSNLATTVGFGTYLVALLLRQRSVVAVQALAFAFFYQLDLSKGLISHGLVNHVHFVEKFVITQFSFLSYKRTLVRRE